MAKLAVAPPLAGGVMFAGVKEQPTEALLAPHVNPTDALYPFSEVTITVEVVENPTLTFEEAGERLSEKSMILKLNVTW